jgi:flavodoxin
MKFTSCILIVLLIGTVSCSSGAQNQGEATNAPGGRADKENILIVYLTRTGNTEAVAKMIQANVGGSLVSLELENPYPKDYQAIVRQVDQENEKGYLPPLKTRIDNVQRYQTIFLGFPTWDMQLPPPMKSFLNAYELSGKTVVPFNTNAGYGAGSGFEQVKQLCRRCTILEGFEIKGGVERDGTLFVMEGGVEKEARTKVNEWLQRIGLVNKSRSDTK